MQRRTIKSFVLRAGRTSQRQKQALETWLSDYQLFLSASPWDLEEIFGRSADTVVEIGFGMGGSLVEMACAQPEVNFIGIEVHQAGVGSLVAALHDKQISNVRVVMHDAVEVLTQCIKNDALAGIQIFFPDPWPKKKHHKRRLIQPDFVALLSQKIRPGGFMHCATDWEEYANHMLHTLNLEKELVSAGEGDGFSSRPETRPLTKFEKRGVNLGHGVWDLIRRRRA